MPVRTAEAVWDGSLREGKGKMKFGKGMFEGPFTWSSRFENAEGTNPEELLGAAHAGCYSMALSSGLGKAGFTPVTIHTLARVTIEKVGGHDRITRIHLETEASVPGISNEQFQQIAENTRTGCPVSNALASVPITLSATLIP
jgi:lipoyl-dependent peroxiredoxin